MDFINMLPLAPLPPASHFQALCDRSSLSVDVVEEQISVMMKKEKSSIYYKNYPGNLSAADKNQDEDHDGSIDCCWWCRHQVLKSISSPLSINNRMMHDLYVLSSTGQNTKQEQGSGTTMPSSATATHNNNTNSLCCGVSGLLADEICRLKMSDWCYKICDFLGASREIVAVAFNYLDRFLTAEKYIW